MRKFLNSKLSAILPAFACLSLLGTGTAVWFFGNPTVDASATGKVALAPYATSGTLQVKDGNGNELTDIYMLLDQPKHTTVDGAISYDTDDVNAGGGISFYTDPTCSTSPIDTLTVDFTWDQSETVKNYDGLNWACTFGVKTDNSVAISILDYIDFTYRNAQLAKTDGSHPNIAFSSDNQSIVSISNGYEFTKKDDDSGFTATIPIAGFNVKYLYNKIPKTLAEWEELSNVGDYCLINVMAAYDPNATASSSS